MSSNQWNRIEWSERRPDPRAPLVREEANARSVQNINYYRCKLIIFVIQICMERDRSKNCSYICFWFFINLIMIFHTVNDFLKVWTIVYTQIGRKLVTAFTGKAINNCVSSTLNCLQWSQIKESHGWRCFRTCNIDTYSVCVPQYNLVLYFLCIRKKYFVL